MKDLHFLARTWYEVSMVVSMGPGDAEFRALRVQADFEGRSMLDVARQAIRQYVTSCGPDEPVDDVVDEESGRPAAAPRRLAR